LEFHIHPVHVLSSAGDRLRLTVACWIDTEQHRSSAPAAARAAGAPGRQPNEPVSISPAGSYVPMTTPVVDTTLSTSRSLPGIVPPANSRLPEPTTTGNTHSRYRSTRLCRISVCSRSPLPCTCSSGPSVRFSAATPSAASPSIRTDGAQSSAGRPRDATYLVASLSGLAPSSVAVGQ